MREAAHLRRHVANARADPRQRDLRFVRSAVAPARLVVSSPVLVVFAWSSIQCLCVTFKTRSTCRSRSRLSVNQLRRSGCFSKECCSIWSGEIGLTFRTVRSVVGLQSV